ncbi:hypothetical protein ACT4GA_003274 [Vibrio vulnificus]
MILVLTGCDLEDKQTSSTSTDVISPSVVAQNATFVAEYNDIYVVDLSENVTVSKGSSFVISQVQPLNSSPECSVHEVSATSFTISASSSKVCDYRYRVSLANSPEIERNHSRSDSYPEPGSLVLDTAVVRVAVSREVAEVEAVQLNAISATTMIEQQVTVNIYQQLMLQSGYTVPLGYTLSEQVTLPYSTATALSDPVNNTITYTPPMGFEGIERILFSYINDTTGEVLLGTLDVAVAHGVNAGLIVEDNISYGQQLAINTTYSIDVAPYVTSLDGDPFQLISVNSSNSTTNPSNATVDNTAFDFLTSKDGYHYVAFAVTDHRGAYAMGQMKISVIDPDSYGTWDGIALNGLWYTKPLTSSEAAASGFTYNGTFVDYAYAPALELATSRYPNADKQCAQLGRLPTQAEMVALYNEGVKLKYDWPTSVPYLATQDSVPITINLASSGESAGQVGTPNENETYLVTCVVGGVTAQGPETETVANGNDEALVVFFVGEGSVVEEGKGPEIIPSPGKSISVTANSANVTLMPNSIITDNSGKATVSVMSQVAEEVQICGTVDSSQQQACTKITFIGDAATARVVNGSISTTSWMPEDHSNYYLIANVEDANANVVPNVVVNALKTYDDNLDSAVLGSSSSLTNSNGEATFIVQNFETNSSDSVTFQLSHTNTSENTSEFTVNSHWGVWQWANPLRVATPHHMGVTILGARPSCEQTLGEGWRYPTAAEIDEYIDARTANVNGFFDIRGGATRDPIYNSLGKEDYYLLSPKTDGSQVVVSSYLKFDNSNDSYLLVHFGYKLQTVFFEGLGVSWPYGKVYDSDKVGGTYRATLCGDSSCSNLEGPSFCVKNLQ